MGLVKGVRNRQDHLTELDGTTYIGMQPMVGDANISLAFKLFNFRKVVKNLRKHA
jgi:hypothetical protein